MEKRNRILVLTDFSENSENLVNFAFKFSEVINAKVIFVHQIPGFVPALADEASRDELLKAEAQEAYAKLRKLSNGRVPSNDSFQVSHKPLLTIITNLADDSYFDWVFAGLKGTGALKRLLIGSTTLSIIDNSNFLTVAVPIHSRFPVPKKLLIGVTSRFRLNKEHIQKVLTSLKEQAPIIEFFTILKTGEDELKASAFLEELQNEFIGFNPGIEVYKGNNAFQLLKEKVDSTEDSFLVLQQGSRSLTDHIFRKFMINELVYGAQTPLIVLSS